MSQQGPGALRLAFKYALTTLHTHLAFVQARILFVAVLAFAVLAGSASAGEAFDKRRQATQHFRLGQTLVELPGQIDIS